MTLLNTIHQLYDFHFWARDRLLAGIATLTPKQYITPLPGGWGSIRDTIIHTVEAEEIWFTRLRGHSPTGFGDPAQTPKSALIQEPGQIEERPRPKFKPDKNEETV